MPAGALACLLAASVGGCSIERSGLGSGEADAGGPDAVDASPRDGGGPGRDGAAGDAATDAGPGRDAGLDAGPGAEDAGPPFCDPAASTLVACYRFEDSLDDGSSHGNHLSGTNHAFAAGRVGRAVQTFAGTALTAGDHDSLDVSALTLELWVRPESLPVTGRAGLADKNGAFGMFVHTGGEVRCSASVGTTVSVGGALSTEAWTHVACTYDGSALRLYVDGALGAEGTATGSIASTDAALHLGDDSPGGGSQLLGRLDELRLWNEARTPAEIAQAAAR